MIIPIRRGGTRTVTITETVAEEPLKMNLNVRGNPDDEPGGDDDDEPSPIPDKQYYELPCEKISRILFDFKIEKFLKGTLKLGDYTYYRATINQSVYTTFKKLVGNEMSVLEPHFFQDKEKIGRGAKVEVPGKNLLILAAEPYVTGKTDSKQIWCFSVAIQTES